MLTHRKFTVFKKDDERGLIELPEGTFFVLKDLDALGVMTIRSYVSNAMQILDWGLDPTTGRPLTQAQKDDLMQRIDGAQLLADQWAQRPKHLPD